MLKVMLADSSVALVVIDTTNAVQEVVDFLKGCECTVMEVDPQSLGASQDWKDEPYRYQASPVERQGLLISALKAQIKKRDEQIEQVDAWMWEWTMSRRLNSDLGKVLSELNLHSSGPWTFSRDDLLTLAAAGTGMLAIQAALNSLEWDSEIVDKVATLVRQAGLPIIDQAESNCSPEELEELYTHDEHPIFRRIEWRNAVAQDETLLGYWEWVHHEINGDE